MNLHPGILDLRFRIVNIVYKNVKPQKLFKIKKNKKNYGHGHNINNYIFYH